MPRGKRRNVDNVDEEQFNTAKRMRTSNRRNTRAEEFSAFNTKRCLDWFKKYTNTNDTDTIEPHGMERFCRDLNVAPENIVMLVLAYKLQARQMGYFTKEEWLKGFTDIQCDSLNKLLAKLESLRNLLNDVTSFKSIYRYAFDFARDKDQRSMDIDTAKGMLQLLLSSHWSLYGEFNQFLQQSKYKVINKDQWCNILEFSRTISNDLSNYDVDGAWPVLLDEFVEWLKATGNPTTTS